LGAADATQGTAAQASTETGRAGGVEPGGAAGGSNQLRARRKTTEEEPQRTSCPPANRAEPPRRSASCQASLGGAAWRHASAWPGLGCGLAPPAAAAPPDAPWRGPAAARPPLAAALGAAPRRLPRVAWLTSRQPRRRRRGPNGRQHPRTPRASRTTRFSTRCAASSPAASPRAATATPPGARTRHHAGNAGILRLLPLSLLCHTVSSLQRSQAPWMFFPLLDRQQPPNMRPAMRTPTPGDSHLVAS